MQKLIFIFSIFVYVTEIQAEENLNDIGNPGVDATFDVCMKEGAMNAGLVKKMLKPPYSCDLNLEPQNRVGRSATQYKAHYEGVHNFMLHVPNIRQHCAMALVYCIEGIPDMKQEDKESEVQKIIRSLYPEQFK
jgi:hypothetical protein